LSKETCWPSCLCFDRGADEIPAIEELSEEDQQLKNELEMLVERLKVWCPHVEVPNDVNSHLFYRNPIPLYIGPL